jgi:DNA-binding response OmpR family regulator
MLTALGDIDDRITGLDAGADDYLVKPFAFGELLSRVRALVRRGRPPRPTALRCGLLSLDPATRLVAWGEVPIELSSREFALLEFLLHHAGDVVQRTTIRRHVWGGQMDEQHSNIIDAYVKNLRDKIDRRFDVSVIETIRGVGYRLRDPEGE